MRRNAMRCDAMGCDAMQCDNLFSLFGLQHKTMTCAAPISTILRRIRLPLFSLLAAVDRMYPVKANANGNPSRRDQTCHPTITHVRTLETESPKSLQITLNVNRRCLPQTRLLSSLSHLSYLSSLSGLFISSSLRQGGSILSSGLVTALGICSCIHRRTAFYG